MSVIKFIATALLTSISILPAIAADRLKVVKFPAGATSITLKGSLKGRDTVTYDIAAAAGQVMQLLFTPTNRSCYFNVFEPGAKPGVAAASHIGSTSGNEFGVSPTERGAYKAQVYLMRNAARRNEKCGYSLSIEITGSPGGISAGRSDTMMRDACLARAAPMYGVASSKIKLAKSIVTAKGGGFMIDGSVDKGNEGMKKLRCIFKASRELADIMAMTSDGE